RELLFKLLAKLGITKERVYYIGSKTALPAPLDQEEEKRLIELLPTGDEEARARLIEHNLRLVVYIARKFENTGIHIEDLISIGTIGLIKAVNTFNPNKNIKLATYASRCIENENLMYLRKNSRVKTEVSLEEPFTVDCAGNALLLSDVLGTEDDVITRTLESKVENPLLVQALSTLKGREKQILELPFGLVGD